jgi:hypothetical protein
VILRTPAFRDEDPLFKLPYVPEAAFNSHTNQYKPECLPNTRVELLDQIKEWINSPHGKCILWLNGMAGMGKSTIARTLARDWDGQGKLGASFFFSRGGGDRSQSRKLFTTLSFYLAKASRIIERSICDAIREHRDIVHQSLRDQWEHLIHGPLSKQEQNQLLPSVLVFVIDALDECEPREDLPEIIRLFAAAKNLKSIQLRVLLTSRPEYMIQHGFNKTPEDAFEEIKLHSIPTPVISRDISILYQSKLDEIRQDLKLPSEWPSKSDIKYLVEMTYGSFIFAATVCRFIRGKRQPPLLGGVKGRLSQILTGGMSSGSPMQALDKIYAQILEKSVLGDLDESDREEVINLFKQIVGTIVVLFEPLSKGALSDLLRISVHDTDSILDTLHSVLNIPKEHGSPIRLLHPSYRDFLLDHNRCQDNSFWINNQIAHNELAENCLRVLSSGVLKRDICGLKEPGILINDIQKDQVNYHLPSNVQYACQYWTRHLQQVDSDRQEKVGLKDGGQVHIFLQENFLYWLEALSLMGKISEGILMIQGLESMLKAYTLTVSDSTTLQSS